MSGQDSPPQAPRRKKLVLRKIAVDGGGSVPDTWSNSYTGPLPAVRPPPRLSSPMIVVEPADADPEIISEVAIESTVIVAPSPDAWAAAAMTASAPSSTGIPTARSPMFAFEVPAIAPVPARRTDGATRTTVAPVVATLAPMEMVEPPLPAFGRGRFSLDSKVLAAGGALAAAMLLIALGVVLGVHSNHASPSAATSLASAPLAVEAKAAGSTLAAPPVAVEVPAAAAPATTALQANDSATSGTTGTAEAVRAEIMATVDISQLPTAPTTHGRWAAAARTAGATGWTVAASPAARPAAAAPAAAPAAVEATQADNATETAPAVEVPVAAPPVPVDPLVQAVREDIREDEARTK